MKMLSRIIKMMKLRMCRAMMKMTKPRMCVMMMKMLVMVTKMMKLRCTMMTKMMPVVKEKTKLRECKLMMKMLPMVPLMRMKCYLKTCRAMRQKNIVLMLTLLLGQQQSQTRASDDLAASIAAVKDTKAAEEISLTSEVAKVRVEEYDSESTLRRCAKTEISRRQALGAPVSKVNSKLGTKTKDPLQKGAITRKEDSKK